MYLISHRGNINGIEKDNENNPSYINKAISNGYNVEVDVRYENGQFFLGHDFNQFKVEKEFLLNEKLWCHAKTNEALLALDEIKAHYFWHQEDDYTIKAKVSFGHILVKNYYLKVFVFYQKKQIMIKLIVWEFVQILLKDINKK